MSVTIMTVRENQGIVSSHVLILRIPDMIDCLSIFAYYSYDYNKAVKTIVLVQAMSYCDAVGCLTP